MDLADRKAPAGSRLLARGAPRPPERIAHLGLGAFHRAHQAWYTARSDDAAEWGIVAFTGRSADLAERLARQDGLYTLVERGAESDRYDVVDSIVRVVAGSEVDEFVRTLANPDVVILTLTITEAGYLLDDAGEIDLDDGSIRADIAALRAARGGVVRTAPARIVAGLAARRAAGAGPLTIVSCDNLPDNGGLVLRGILAIAERVDVGLASWISEHVATVSTSVDRITPRVGVDLERDVETATGRHDEAPVLTEPFSDWTISGEFATSRPRWESAGARFVPDVRPWELRKLWLLNGAHTILASVGALRGFDTVSAAIDDPPTRRIVDDFWAEAARGLPEAGLEIPDYLVSLLERFRNPRIIHRLDQIAAGSLAKLRVRVVPVAISERRAGRLPVGCATAVAGWIVAVGRRLVPLPEAPQLADAPDRLLTLLSPDLAEDEMFAGEVRRRIALWSGPATDGTETIDRRHGGGPR